MRLITEEDFEAIIQEHGAYESAKDSIEDLVVFLHGQTQSLTATIEIAVKMIESGRFGALTEEDKRRIVRLHALISALKQNRKQN